MDDIQQRPIISLYGNGMQSGSIQSDYYYEDPQLKGRYPQGSLELSRLRNSENFQQKNYQSKIPMNKSPILDDESKKKDSVKKTLDNLSPTLLTTNKIHFSATTTTKTRTMTTTTTTTTLTPVTFRKEDTRIAEHLRMIQNDMKEIDGVNERPSGAILSLTLGLCYYYYYHHFFLSANVSRFILQNFQVCA